MSGSIILAAAPDNPVGTIVVDIQGVSNGVENGTQQVVVGDVTGPTIRGLRTITSGRGRRRTTSIILNFDEPLDPARAQGLSNYTLRASGSDRRFGNRNDRNVALARSTYDPNARTVTLVTARPLAANQAYRLTVNGMSPGAGVSDSVGNLLDGDSNGARGGDFLGRFGRPERPPVSRRGGGARTARGG